MRHIDKFSLILLLTALRCFAQTCTAPPPLNSTRNNLTPPSFRLERVNGALFVSVSVDGRSGFPFLIDTGYDESVLDSSTTQVLRLKTQGEHQEAARAGSVTVAKVQNVKLTIGNVQLPSADLTTVDLSNLAAVVGHPIGGVLGYDFFRLYAVVLDYLDRRMTLCDPLAFRPPPGAAILPVNLDSKQPYVEGEVSTTEGKRVVAMLELDTGSLDALDLNAAFARSRQLFNDRKLLPVRGVSVGGSTQAWITRTSSLQLGPFRLTGPITGVAEENAQRAGQIGAEILRRFRVTLDYSHKQVLLEPNSQLTDRFEFDHTGMLLMAVGGKFDQLQAFMVMVGTPAHKAGIKEGDQVVAVDGKPVASLEEARTLLKT